MIKIREKELAKARENYQYFLVDRCGSFYTRLFDLIAKADPFNKRKLLKSFPAEVYAYCEYTGELDTIQPIIIEGAEDQWEKSQQESLQI